MATAASSVATERAPAATTLDPDVDRHIGAVRESEAERPSGRSLYAGLFFASAFLVTAGALAFSLSSSRSPGLVTVLGLILAYAAASHARFEVGTGLSLPTALVFVPMLFLLPLGYVPLVICAGLLVGAATDLLRRGLPLEKVLLVPLNSWYSIGLLVAFVAVDHPVALTFVLPLIGLLVIFARERQVRIDHALELSHAYRGTALLLGDVVEADDAYTGSHSRDVVTLVLEVSGRLQLNGRDRRDAEFAALLHDIGKIRVPAEIINKPGKLDDHEWAVMKQHTIEGERLLSQVGGLLGNIGHIVRSCHEDWDGTGYPDGTAGNDIPLVARIVRVCDAFSAMTTDRAYRKAQSAQEAVAELRRCAGTDFDPAVVEALAEAVQAGS